MFVKTIRSKMRKGSEGMMKLKTAKVKMKKLVFSASMIFAIGAAKGSDTDSIAQVTWKTLPRYCSSNIGLVKMPVKGIVVEHHGLGCGYFKPDDTRAFGDFAERGIVRIHPHYSPWAWMNDHAVRLSDALVTVVKRHYELGDDAIVVSTGGSMGGLGCLVWARYSQHRIAAVVANCPVTDLAYHYTERPDLPRTIGCAFADAPDLQAAIMAHSPLHLVKSMPDIPYFIVHSTSDEAVNKERHSDRFVAAMEAAGRKIEYLESEGTGHCQLRPEVQARFDAALLLPFKAKCN